MSRSTESFPDCCFCRVEAGCQIVGANPPVLKVGKSPVFGNDSAYDQTLHS